MLTPVTEPPPLTVATAVLLLLQMPPVAPSARLMALPVHTPDGPLMLPADGGVVTVIDAVVMALPQPVLTM